MQLVNPKYYTLLFNVYYYLISVKIAVFLIFAIVFNSSYHVTYELFENVSCIIYLFIALISN